MIGTGNAHRSRDAEQNAIGHFHHINVDRFRIAGDPFRIS
jgi:hypothetical protein